MTVAHYLQSQKSKIDMPQLLNCQFLVNIFMDFSRCETILFENSGFQTEIKYASEHLTDLNFI